ncbi:MAG: hypothetical protein H6839_01905 [Planctomycetes bacterium]|nr:hypothetical protein [Planctomycetota bacterium]
MHGLIVGAILGVAFMGFMGAYRSVRTWKSVKRRPPVWVLGIQVGLQVALGVVALVYAIYFMIGGE